jgi:hypothetical protein
MAKTGIVTRALWRVLRLRVVSRELAANGGKKGTFCTSELAGILQQIKQNHSTLMFLRDKSGETTE